MIDKSGVSPQVISVPQGGGAISGLAEKFSPDLFTGTGNFSVPIALPPGRNGFQPSLQLVYSTGNGNGPFGLGWSLSVPGVNRKTSHGLPRYADELDTFILSGSEDLVPVPGGVDRAQRYRPRTEGAFALIEHVHGPHDNFWRVRTRDGLVSAYGTPGAAGVDPATVADPDNPRHVFAWRLRETKDTFGNRIVYAYERESKLEDGPHRWDQTYLSEIRYADYDGPKGIEFGVIVRFVYERRPDPFSERRAGFEIRTTRRCTRIDILTNFGQERLAKTYHLVYLDQRGVTAGPLPPNHLSFLSQVRVVGRDGDKSEELPPLTVGYTRFDVEGGMKLHRLTGPDLPKVALGHPTLELADLLGRGLPDFVEISTQGTRYWKNLGDGTFDWPRIMKDAPAGLSLGDPGVQLMDADGDGRIDLMVTTETLSGYFPLEANGEWDRHSLRRWKVAPSFDLRDPNVKLVDLDGDGVTDAIRSGARLECYFNDPKTGWGETRRIERGTEAPDVNFSDRRIRWGDMTGDGLQDIVEVSRGSVSYWPSFGRGRFGPRITMRTPPRMPEPFDPQRVLLADVDGDGVTDLVYIGTDRATVWINRAGNSWSEPIDIPGIPVVTDMDAVRVVDLLGTGVGGVLFTAPPSGARERMFFLELTHGKKPYVLDAVDNAMGAITRVAYAPSTRFLLEDAKSRETRWQTTLPTPVQVVARVEVVDALSKGKLTTEYSYHHGYWDGAEREFRGFARVEQRDTEVFADHHAPGLFPDADTEKVAYEMYSPPTETRSWFHLGPVGPEHGEWRELDLTAEYWQEDAPALARSSATTQLLETLERRARRDAVRALRGTTLRSELYAIDGATRESRPYSVTEGLAGLREESPPGRTEIGRRRIFFPHGESFRTTQWERGDDPMTRLSFTGGYDECGQPTMSTSIAVPRGRDYQRPAFGSDPFLATHQVTTYAKSIHPAVFLVDRVSRTTSYELVNAGTMSAFELAAIAAAGNATTEVIADVLNYYDGASFDGMALGLVDTHGALVRTETLVMTAEMLADGYRNGAKATSPPEVPPYLVPGGQPPWTAEYPPEFRNLTPNLGGYTFYDAVNGHHNGYYSQASRRKYDVHTGNGRGLLVAQRDPLGRETAIDYDEFALLPLKVTDPAMLTTHAIYDYRVLRPILVTDANGNRMAVAYSPSGLVLATAAMGKPNEAVGDTTDTPGVAFKYDLLAFLERQEPVSARATKRIHHVHDMDVPEPERSETIVAMAYSDGFGRILQTRTQAEDVVFGSLPFGDAGLAVAQGMAKEVAPSVGTALAPGTPQRVLVSGWQIYDNKGRVVEKYEPFFGVGWDAARPAEADIGKKVRMCYDPRGAVIRTVNPNGSEKRVVHGIPVSLGDPTVYIPTPWEAYAYDENDNAGRTHPLEAKQYASHWGTPASTRVDALGRLVEAIARNGTNPDLKNGDWYVTRTTYDIRGNILTLTDPKGRLAARQVYDLANRVLRSESIDAGVHRTVYDAAGAALEGRDSKGALSLYGSDVAGRPTRLWARDAHGEAVTLRARAVYGETSESNLTLAYAASKNLLGRVYRQYDEAGLVRFDAYDLSGNVTDKARRTISDDAILTAYKDAAARGWEVQAYRVDWGTGAAIQEREAVLLEAKEYRTTTSFDALGRVKRALYPEDVAHGRQEFVPRYNRAGGLESVSLGGSVFVSRIAYNAKGQRLVVAYGNGLMTRYVYDKDTFRLARLRTEKFTTTDGLNYAPAAPSDPLQDFAYDHDLAGNLTAIRERVPGCGVSTGPGGGGALDRLFKYDPLYRLLSANGRETAATPPPNSLREIWDPRPLPSDPTLARAYSEDYTYDRAGNLTELRHSAQGGDFTRKYVVSEVSHRLEQTVIGPTKYAATYDAAGNIVGETTSRHFEWDHANRMRVYRTQVNGSEPSVHAQYLYGARGERVKKLVRTQGGAFRVTTYIDGIFEHDRVGGPVQDENDTLLVLDEVKLVASRRVRSSLDDATPPVKYHFGDHLGSSHIVVADDGALVNREEYRPYGETSFGSFGKKRYRFVGKERDEESGLYHFGARYYAPWLGRWTAADPMGTVDGTNLYAYVRGSPVNLVDPSGTYGFPYSDEQKESMDKVSKALSAQGIGDGGWGYRRDEMIAALDPLKQRRKEAIDAAKKGVSVVVASQKTTEHRKFDDTHPDEPLHRWRDDRNFVNRARALAADYRRVANKDVASVSGKAQTGQELLERLEQATARHGAIKNLVIYTHSGLLGFYMKDDRGVYRWIADNPTAKEGAIELSDLQNKINQGKIKFDPDAVVIIAGCGAAGSEAADTGSLAAHFASRIGVTTIAGLRKSDQSHVPPGRQDLEFSPRGWVRFEKNTGNPHLLTADETGSGSQQLLRPLTHLNR